MFSQQNVFSSLLFFIELHTASALSVYYCCEIQHFHLVVKTDTAHSNGFIRARMFYLERSNTLLFC